jgi:hypothetical protein
MNIPRSHEVTGFSAPTGDDHPPCIAAGDIRARQIRRKPVLSGLINEYVHAA